MYWDQLAAQVRNWGRWGAEDERGTVNLITPAKLRQAAECVRQGRIISLSIPFDSNGPIAGRHGRFNPVHYMVQDSADGPTQGQFMGELRYTEDHIIMPLQVATQWDALAHCYYGDRLYNGFPASTVTSAGAARDSIDKMYQGIASRGTLLDIARLRGVRYLAGGEAIGADDLEAAEAAQGVRVEEGDILLVRTGWWVKFLDERNAAAWWETEPGLDHTTIMWMHRRGVAAVAADNWGVEVAVGPGNDRSRPIHAIALRDMGLPLGEVFDLEELSQACAESGQYTFLLVAAPLRVTGAVGSPINPIAIL